MIVVAALAANPDLDIAAARVDQARAQLRSARAPLAPAVNANLSGMRQGTSTNAGTVTEKYFDAGLSASYELDLWGRNRAAAGSARHALTASGFDQQAQRLSIGAQAADLYLQILALRDRMRIARQNLQAAREILTQTEARARNGAALDRDVDAQRALVADREAILPDLVQSETEALAALAILLGRAPQGFTLKAAGMGSLSFPPIVTPGLTTELLERRPDIAAADARLAAAGADVASARAAMLPRLTLSGSGGGRFGLGPSTALYELIAGLAQPLFDYGALAGQRDLALGLQRERTAEYRQAVLNALADVEKALVAMRTSEETLAARQTGAEAAQRAEAQTSARFRAGAEDMITVLNAQTTLYDARDAALTARALRLRAIVALYRVLGGGWSSERIGEAPR